MSISIVIQHQEIDPHNPGWWRYGRPCHQVVAEPPAIRERYRWTYGSAADAVAAQAVWDQAHAQG